MLLTRSDTPLARYEIVGGTPLRGEVTISGAKNAAVAILPAALLVSGKCRIENVPDISDVRILLDIMRSMGASVAWAAPGVVEIDCSDVTCTEPDADLVKSAQASYDPIKNITIITKNSNHILPCPCLFVFHICRNMCTVCNITATNYTNFNFILFLDGVVYLIERYN